MQLNMKRTLLIFTLALLVISTGCVSKKYLKRGIKFEEAGLWELAAESYIQSLTSKRDNLDAVVGLKRTGQKVIDEKCYKSITAYESDNLKQAVYSYLDAVDFSKRTSLLGVELQINDRATDYFKDAKPKYIETVYTQAQQLMDAEKFQQAEALLDEIKKLEPDYGNVKEMLKVSKCEPLYRQGKQLMESGFYRKSYGNFNQIITEYGSYKDAALLMGDALQKAIITIKVSNFTEGYCTKAISQRIQSSVVAAVNALNNPFIKIVDTDNTTQLIEEQQRSLTQGSDIEVGRILAAKAILTGEMLECKQDAGRLSKSDKRGYLKEVTKVKNPVTGEMESKVEYKKVSYEVYSIQNRVTYSLKFQLTSTETGTVMVSDIARSQQADETTYAVFAGKPDKLVPGYWENASKDSPKDYVSDNPGDISTLQKMLQARREIASLDQLTDKAVADLSKQVSERIGRYNPEQ